MYRFLIVILVWSFAVSIFAQKNYNISITVKGIKNEKAILAYYYENNKYIIDSLFFNENSTTIIKGNKDYPDGVYLLAFPSLKYKYFDILLKDSSFSITTDTSELILNMKINNSLENKALYEDLRYMNPMGIRADSLIKLQKQLNNPNSQQHQEINKLLEAQSEQIKTHRKQLVQKYKNTFYANLLQIMQAPIIPEYFLNENHSWIDTTTTIAYIKQHYFDIINFNDSGYIRTPIFKNYIHHFFDIYCHPAPDSIIYYIEQLLPKAANNQLLYKYILNTLLDKYAQSKIMGHDAIYAHIADNYYLNGKTNWMEEANLKKLKDYIDDIRPTLIGKIAPDFQFRDSSMRNLFFYSLLDKSTYTLLVFWNSDCGHCQKEIPLLKQLNDSLLTFDVQIIAISTEQTDSTFKKFVREKCHNDWICGWDPYGTSAFRREYNVVTTPRLFLINRNDKKIKGKNLPVNAIYNFIDLLEQGK